jgi:hypothetical protein
VVATTPGSRPPADGPWIRVLDAATDASLVGFAVWTLAYEVALAGRWSLWWPGRIWLVGMVIGVGAWCLRAFRRPEAVACEVSGSVDAAGTIEHAATPPWRSSERLGVLAALLLAAVAVMVRDSAGVLPVTLIGLGTVLWLLWRDRRVSRVVGPRLRNTGVQSLGRRPRWMHVVVLLTCVGLALLAALLVKPDADDAYYVNRATWVAQHGVPVALDTMFSPGTLPSTYGGGLPVASVEALQGAIAHALGLQAPTVAYLLFAPLMAAGFGWITWRLIRRWAPRRALLAFLVSATFVVLSGESVIGNYSVGRIWQGKVVAFTVLMPLVWHAFSRLLDRSDRRVQAYLFACGVAFVGLTSTAVLLAPVLTGVALLASWILRARALAVGAIAFLAAPLIAGVAVTVGPGHVGGLDPIAMPRDAAFTILLGPATPMVLVGLAAMVLGPRVVAPSYSVLLMCGSVATFVALLPGIFPLVNAVTGAGPVAWRLMLGVPVWVLVGLLVAAPEPSAWVRLGSQRRRRLGVALGATLAGALVAASTLSGVWLWSSRIGGRLEATPSWKVSAQALENVRSVNTGRVPKGLWLLPPEEMQVMAISDTRHFTVVPRDLYLSGLTAGTRDLQDRLVLLGLVSGRAVSRAGVRSALDRLDVTLACVPWDDQRARRILAAVVDQPLQPVGAMRCHVADR